MFNIETNKRPVFRSRDQYWPIRGRNMIRLAWVGPEWISVKSTKSHKSYLELRNPCHYVIMSSLDFSKIQVKSWICFWIYFSSVSLISVCMVYAKLSLKNITILTIQSNFYKTWWGFRWMNIYQDDVLKKNNLTISTSGTRHHILYLYYLNTEAKYRKSCLQVSIEKSKVFYIKLADKFKFVCQLAVSTNKCKLLTLEAIFVRISAIHPFLIRCRRVFVGATKHSQNYQHFMIPGIHQEC